MIFVTLKATFNSHAPPRYVGYDVIMLNSHFRTVRMLLIISNLIVTYIVQYYLYYPIINTYYYILNLIEIKEILLKGKYTFLGLCGITRSSGGYSGRERW